MTMQPKYSNQLSIRMRDQQMLPCRKCKAKTAHERSVLRVWRCVECGTAFLGFGRQAEVGDA